MAAFKYEYKVPSEAQHPSHNLLMRLFAVSDSEELAQEDVDAISRWIDSSEQGPVTKRLLHKALKNKSLTEEEQQMVAYDLFEGKQMIRLLEDSWDETEGVRRLDDLLLHMDGVQHEALAVRIRQLILQGVIEQSGMERFKNRFEAYAIERRLL